MSRDYFQWFDPWEDRQRWLEYGREEVLDQIGREALPEFMEALAEHAGQLARDLARKVLEPKMGERLATVRAEMELERALTARIMLSVGPELHTMLRDLRPSLRIEDGPRDGSAVAIVSARQTFHVDRHEAFPSRVWR